MSFAAKNLRLHWLRSLLAVIGIVIGVLAIGYMGITQNMELMSISEQYKAYDSFTITTNSEYAMKQGRDTVITERQVFLIRQAAPGHLVIPVYSDYEDQIKTRNEYISASLIGIRSQDLTRIIGISSGMMPRSGSEVAIGSDVAMTNNLKIGSMLTITKKNGEENEESNTPVRVVGILEPYTRWDLLVNYAIVPYEPWLRDHIGFKGYNQVLVKLSDISEMNETIKEVNNELNIRAQEINIDDFNQYRDQYLQSMEQKAATTTAIAGISLIVAGVSIFNVMVMSVMERYREIGVLRSIGTRRGAILSMFIYESAFLGIVGSAIGGIISVGLGYLQASMISGLHFFFAPATLMQVPYAMSFGIGISLLSGLYPAWKASRLNPIEALRYE
jgi:putative ABC transport system permease protein